MVSGVDFEPKNLASSPTQLKINRTKFQSSTRRAETRINFFTDIFGINIRNFGSLILRIIQGTETSGLTKTTETHTEVSVERKPENLLIFRAKMNYCVIGPSLKNYKYQSTTATTTTSSVATV
jgi:hypothetical protein